MVLSSESLFFTEALGIDASELIEKLCVHIDSLFNF